MAAALPAAPSSVRWLAAVAVADFPLVVIAFSYWWWRERLPDPLPVHWGAGGRVDGTASQPATVAAFLAVAALGSAAAVAGLLGRRMRWRARRVLVTVAAVTSGFAAALWLMIALLSLDAPGAYAAAAPSWHVLAITPAVAGWAWLAAAACGRPPAWPAAIGRPPGHLPRHRRPSGEPVEFSEIVTASASAYLVLLTLLLGTAAVLALWVDAWAASPVLLVAVACLIVLTVRLGVDSHGLHVGFGPWGWPRMTVPLREIAYAEVIDVRPAEWGGWGYRLRRSGRGLVLRRGPGVRLELSAGRHFVASARDPERVAGLLNALLDDLGRKPVAAR
jgi:hypothetical protein